MSRSDPCFGSSGYHKSADVPFRMWIISAPASEIGRLQS